MRAWLIVGGLLGVLLGSAALLGPRTAAPPLPAALVGDDPGWLQQAAAIGRWRLGLGIAQLIIAPLALWFLVRAGWAAHARDWLLEHGFRQPWLLVGAYAMGLVIMLAVLQVPLDYLSLAVRRAYGLSNETTLAWLLRQVLSWAINGLIMLITIEGAYWLIRIAPRSWWLWGSLGYLALAVVLVYLQPLVITPLFYRQTPLQDPGLLAEIQALGQRVGVPINEVFVIDASKQGSEGNAYFTGIGGSTRVVIYDTLLATYPHDELLAVLAHEMGHWRERHVWQALALSALLAPLGLAVLQWGSSWLLPRWGIANAQDIASLPLALLIIMVSTTASLPCQNALSRRWEQTADQIALQATNDGPALAKTFVRLARQNLSNPTPAPLVEGVFATHPALGRRVAAAQQERLHP